MRRYTIYNYQNLLVLLKKIYLLNSEIRLYYHTVNYKVCYVTDANRFIIIIRFKDFDEKWIDKCKRYKTTDVSTYLFLRKRGYKIEYRFRACKEGIRKKKI